MNTKHTQGDWVLETENPKVLPYVILKNDTRSLSICVYLSSRERVRNNYSDATYDYSDKGSICLSEENMANAKLIASAPKLLEALNNSISLLKNTTEFDILVSYKDKVLAFEKLINKIIK